MISKTTSHAQAFFLGIQNQAANLFPYFCALFPILLPAYRYGLNLSSLFISLLELYVIVVISGGLIVLYCRQYSLLRLWNQKKSLLILSSIFIATGAISLFYAVSIRFSLGIFRVYFVEHFLVAMIFWCLHDAGVFEKRHVRLAFISGVILLVFVGAHTLLQNADLLPSPMPWISESPRRASSFFAHPNSLGLLIAPFVVFYMVFCLYSIEQPFKCPRAIRLSAATASFFGSIAVILSRSDGALVALVMGVSAYLLFSRYARRLLIIAMFLGCIAIALPEARSYITRALTEGSLASRGILWENTIRLLRDYPIEGAGLGDFQYMVESYRTLPKQEALTYPHLIVLNFWVELGVVGLLAVVGMVSLALANLWRRIHREKHVVFTALFCVWVTVLVHGLVDVPFFNNDLSLLWWLLVWA